MFQFGINKDVGLNGELEIALRGKVECVVLDKTTGIIADLKLL